MRVAQQFNTQHSTFNIATPPLRFPQVFRYEPYFAWREPHGCLPIALVDEGIVDGFATADPRHEVVDCHVGKWLTGNTRGQVPSWCRVGWGKWS